MRRRSAFTRIKASKTKVGSKGSEPQSKGKELTSQHDATYPRGESHLNRLRHPVGVRGHVPQKRSVNILQREAKSFCGHVIVIFVLLYLFAET